MKIFKGKSYFFISQSSRLVKTVVYFKNSASILIRGMCNLDLTGWD